MFKNTISIIGKRNFFNLLKFIPLIFVISFLDILGITSLIPVLQFLSGQEISYFNYNLNNIFDNFDKSKILYMFLIFIFLINIFRFILALLNNYFFNKVTLEIQISMQKKILQDYLFGSWFQNLDKNTSEKIRDVDQETSILKSNIILPVFSIISDILIILIMLIFLFFHIDFETLLIVFVAGVICFLFFVFNKKRITNYGKFRRKYEKKRFEKILEIINGIREIKFFSFGDKIIQEFLKVSNDLKSIYLKQGVLLIMPKNILEITVLVLLITLIIFFYNSGMPFELIISSLAVYVIATYKIIPSFYKIMINLQSINFASPTVDSLLNVIQKKYDTENLRKIKINNFKTISYKSINFRYPNSSKKIITNFNFTLKKNSSVAILGDSGVGKSTLIDLITGLIKPDEGKILIDDKETEIFFSNLKDKIGIVTQKLYLFEASVKDNITFFQEEKFTDISRLFDCLNKVNLKRFANQKDIENIIKEDGKNLSGGERQRIGLARCLYQNREIIILDEPTNNLDKKSEDKFFETLMEIKNDKTILIVTHDNRLSKFCDQKILIGKNHNLVEENKL